VEGADGSRRRYLIYGDDPSHHREDGTDFAAIDSGAVSVTPRHFVLTDIDGMERLERLRLAELLPAQPTGDPRK